MSYSVKDIARYSVYFSNAVGYTARMAEDVEGQWVRACSDTTERWMPYAYEGEDGDWVATMEPDPSGEWTRYIE